MAITEFQFTPTTGWNDATAFPTSPTTEAATRQMHQNLHDQTKSEINTIIGELNTNFATKAEITNDRKLSPTGNFTGTWNGLVPTASDPGLAATVNAHLAEIAHEVGKLYAYNNIGGAL